MGMGTCFWLMWVGGDVANVCVCVQGRVLRYVYLPVSWWGDGLVMEEGETLGRGADV